MSDSLELELQAVVGNLATGSGCRGRKWGPLEEQQGLLMADPTTSIFEIGSRAYLELINLARLNNYPEISRVLLSLPTQLWDYRHALLCQTFIWVLGIRTRVPMLVRQAHYQASHPPAYCLYFIRLKC